MKTILMMAAVALFGATGAQAADIAARPYKKAPVLAQVYDWTGFYIGANVGVGVGDTPTNSNFANLAFQASPISGIGAIGGVQAGYNWQWKDIVLGVETDIQGSGINSDPSCTGSCTPGLSTLLSQKQNWFGTTRVRAGLATGPVFSYVTGGVVYGDINTSTSIAIASPFTTFARNQSRTGWTVGSGVEAAIGGNWTAKVEYLYLDFGNDGVGIGVVGGFPVALTADTHAHIFRAGVNYRFGNRPYSAEPTANWAGWYAGLNAGSGVGRNSVAATNNPLGLVTPETFASLPKGYLGGAQIGYNWQASNWVLGAEADIQGTSLRDAKNCFLQCQLALPFFGVNEQSMPWLGTVRGRVGYSVGSTLFYGTAGVAFGEVKNKLFVTNNAGANFQGTFSDTKAGWTAGAGIESPLEFFGYFGKNWTVKGEYLYVDLGSVTNNYTFAAAPGSLRTDVTTHIFRSGINYHFNSPVVAKY